MTVLENSIRIDAPLAEVWSVLASLDALDQYDPGIKKSEVVSDAREGPGSARRCDLAAGGWFKEKVTDWQPQRSVAFELFECTLPVRRLTHSYLLSANAGETLVRQRMEYELKFGPVGRLLDAIVVRKKWDAGVRAFFVGLKEYVEARAANAA